MVEKKADVEYISLHGCIRDIPSDTKAMHNTSWKWRGVLDQWKRIYGTTQNSVGQRNWVGGNRSVSRTGPALGGWGNWNSSPISTSGQLLSQRRNISGWDWNCWSVAGKMEWESDSPCCSQGHRATRRCSSWDLELVIVEQSQGDGSYWLWRDSSKGCEGGDCGGKCLWRKARQPWKQGDTVGAHVEGGVIIIASLSPHGSIRRWTIVTGP